MQMLVMHATSGNVLTDLLAALAHLVGWLV